MKSSLTKFATDINNNKRIDKKRKKEIIILLIKNLYKYFSINNLYNDNAFIHIKFNNRFSLSFLYCHFFLWKKKITQFI